MQLKYNVSNFAKDTAPLISVITSTLNAESSIGLTIRSIRECEYPNIEYIIIDGGSTDATADIVQQAGDVVSVFISESDTGIYNAWNKALRLSKGKYIAFLGSGDAFATNGLNILVACALANQEADYICSKAVISSKRLSRTIGRAWHWEGFKRNMCVVHPGSLHSSRLFKLYGEFDESFRIAGDYEFLLRAGKNLRTAFVDNITVTLAAGGVSRSGCNVIDETSIAKTKNNSVPGWVIRYDSIIAKIKIICGRMLFLWKI